MSALTRGRGGSAQMPRTPPPRQVSMQRRLSSRVISYHNVVKRSQVACFKRTLALFCRVGISMCNYPGGRTIYTISKCCGFAKYHIFFLFNKILKLSVRTFFALMDDTWKKKIKSCVHAKCLMPSTCHVEKLQTKISNPSGSWWK